jgi:hypothetical protein
MHSHVGTHKSLSVHFIHIVLLSSKCIVKGIKFGSPGFPTFSLSDLERLKDTDKWLSDSHVAFGLMLVTVTFWSL